MYNSIFANNQENASRKDRDFRRKNCHLETCWTLKRGLYSSTKIKSFLWPDVHHGMEATISLSSKKALKEEVKSHLFQQYAYRWPSRIAVDPIFVGRCASRRWNYASNGILVPKQAWTMYSLNDIIKSKNSYGHVLTINGLVLLLGFKRYK